MDSRTLIDSIVRQTTVLIAQVSTAAGIRAPLAHVADQVFRDLSAELEQQGVRQKVVADMFGLALRTYQKKTRRLAASRSERNSTLWEAVVRYLSDHGPSTRRELDRRFRHEEGRDLAAVLRDLTDSGLVYRTGAGLDSAFGMSSDGDRQALREGAQQSRILEFVWLTVFRDGPLSAQELAKLLSSSESAIAAALEELQAEGRIEPTKDGERYLAHSWSIPVGASQGWEAAVFDHFQTMVLAISSKLTSSSSAAPPTSRPDDATGGATLAFDISDDHPLRGEVLGLLSSVRADVNELWDRVEAHNASHPLDPGALRRVSFYFGQFTPDEDCCVGG